MDSGTYEAYEPAPTDTGVCAREEIAIAKRRKIAALKDNRLRYCHFWKNNKKGCCLGEENCYYLISVSPKPKSECEGCPYGRDHPCIGWCTRKIMKEVGVR